MRGLRGLAGALALAILAGEARSQYYPYNPYPQPQPYGYGYAPYPGGYNGNPYPYYNGSAQGTYYPPGNAGYASRSQYPATPLPAGGQGMGAPPIFMQSSLEQPISQGRYLSAGALSPPQAAPAPVPPAAANSNERPLVLQPQAPSTPTFPRNLPSDPKSEADSKPEAAKKDKEDDEAPEAKKPGKKDDSDDGATAQPDRLEKPSEPAPQQGEPPADKGNTENKGYLSFLTGSLAQPHAPRLWASVEYLLWWERNAPIGVPLVTTNPNVGNPGVIGALNEPGTKVLLGPGGARPGVNFDAFNGGRFTFGGWIDPDSSVGLETSGLVLERRGAFFTASSGGTGTPVASIPFNATQPYNLNPAGETSLNGGGAPNVITVSNYSHLWGMEANAVFNLSNSPAFRLVGLVGLRYLNLTESLMLSDIFTDSVTGGAVVVQDSFGTQNHFFGGQIGLRGGTNYDRFTFDASFKLAFGDNSQNVSINGVSGVLNGAFGLTGGAAGIFAQPSNIGRFHRDEFSMVPELNLQLGYLLTPNVRPFVSYNVLWLSRALRPGEQLNRNINPTENPTFGGTMGVPFGLPAPLPAFHTSEFWAQGFTFGVEVRY